MGVSAVHTVLTSKMLNEKGRQLCETLSEKLVLYVNIWSKKCIGFMIRVL